MANKKCTQCGLVNYSFEEECKRCGTGLAAIEAAPIASRQRPKRSKDCPQCESPETRSFEMAYATSTTSGSLVASSFNFDIGTTVTGGTLTQQSALAAYVRPPAPPAGNNALPIFILLGFFAGLVPLILFAALGYPAFGVLMLVATIVAIAIPGSRRGEKEYQHRKADYFKAIAHWHHSWICLRCGYRWAM
jgi:hypothetical protein